MFEVIKPFNFNDVLECLKIAFFFAIGYSVGAFICFELFNWLIERKNKK